MKSQKRKAARQKASSKPPSIHYLGILIAISIAGIIFSLVLLAAGMEFSGQPLYKIFADKTSPDTATQTSSFPETGGNSPDISGTANEFFTNSQPYMDAWHSP